MLQRHLHRWTEALDETAFRVRLKDRSDRAANRAFDEGPIEDGRLDEVLRRAVGARLAAAGLRPARGVRVLDVCCGRGHLGEFVSSEYGATVAFADLSAAQLAQLVRRASGRGSRVSACAADLLALPYASGAFDLVVGHSFLHHVPDVPAAVAEIFRVLKPGGLAGLLHEPNVNANFWESFPLSLAKNTDPRDGFTDLWMFRPEDLRRLFEDQGFVDVRIQGAGVLSAIVLNWWLIALGKLRAAGSAPARGAYRLRQHLNRLEMAARRHVDRAPSLVLVARRPGGTPAERAG